MGNESVFRFRSSSTPGANRPRECRDLCAILDRVFEAVQRRICAGITTAELDRVAANAIVATGCEALFKNNLRNDYPTTITASINDQVVNNIPSSRERKSGDLLSLQIGVARTGTFAYQAWTFLVDRGSDEDMRLWQAGFDALTGAIGRVRAGARVRDVSSTIQSTLESAGFTPGRDYVGHGIGDELHVEPAIPCFVGRARSQDPSLEQTFVENQLLSINVFAHAGSHRTKLEPDQWGVVTRDGSHAVHFSHVVVVGTDGCSTLTSNRNRFAR